MVTPSCVELTLKRPPMLLATLGAVKLVERACASSRPPSWTTVICASSVTSVVVVAVNAAGSVIGSFTGVFAGTARTT